MEGDQFSLCWNNFHNNLSAGFNSLLQDEDLVDVTLAAEGKYLKAHKTVLSVCSPYFKELFRVNPCKHPIVILQDVNYSALCSLLQFMYQGEVSVSQEEIPVFMKVAEMLKIKGLTDNNAQEGENGLDERESSKPHLNLSDEKNLLKRKQVSKKLIKPMLHRSIEPRPLRSPQQSQSPLPVQSPPLKLPRMEEAPVALPIHPEVPINPKQEPIDDTDSFLEGPYDEHMDMASMLDTTLGEPSESLPLSFSPKMPMDVCSPGTLQCVLGRRGIPRLIVDGHTFFKKSSYKQKTFWYCKLNRSHYKCSAVCWTVHGQIVKWPIGHTHAAVKDNFNPDEDTIVPIAEMQRVLIETCGLLFVKSRRGHPVLIHNGHIYILNQKMDNRSTWVCVKQRTLHCEGCVTTTNGPMLLSYSGHNHPQLHDIIQRLQASSCSPSPELP